MELTKSQIKRIDSFLERLGCEYIDIRFEMVDHIATEIEEKVDNYNDFFKKDKMHGKFLGFMMSKKNDLENNYSQQSKKQFWSNLWQIIKSIALSLTSIKTWIVIITSFLLIQILAKYNIKYTVILTVFVSMSITIFGFFYITRAIKHIGKVRIVHSNYLIITIGSYLSLQIPNVFNLFKEENHIPFIANFHFVLILINILLLLDFKKNKNAFKEKYKYLLN